MNIIASFTENGSKYGLTDKPVKTNCYYDGFVVVFSLHNNGSRSSCRRLGECLTCPLESYTSVACYKDQRHYLSKFGITQESHPEYFI